MLVILAILAMLVILAILVILVILAILAILVILRYLQVSEKMRTQAARWDTHGPAWAIYGIPNPTRIG